MNITKPTPLTSDNICGCCGESVEVLYSNPWGGPMNDDGLSYDCIIVSLRDSKDSPNYDFDGWITKNEENWWIKELTKNLLYEVHEEMEIRRDNLD
tara:strand:- start:1288 stop:1575 length:288 start_codon:yes stop_codon:yes gene_type:complete